MQGGAGGRGTARVALARCHSPVPHPSEPPLGEQWFCPGSWAGLCCEECFIGEKKKKKIQQRQAECVSGQDCPPQPAQPVLGIGAAWVHLPSSCPPFVLQLRDPNPDRHPEAGAVKLNAQRGSSGRARRAPGAGAAQRLPHPILALQSQELLCWCGAGGTEGKGGWAGRGLPAGVGVMRSIQRLGAARQHPATPPRGVTEARVGLGGWQQAGAPCVGGGSGVGRELAPAASSWLTWLLQGPGPRAATPSFGQPRFLAWEVPPKLQGPPAARTPPAMGSAVPCP